jgi:hypothetical protein
MTEYFDFSCSEMTQVPVWVKFPNLPLKCWTLRCLSKLASVLGNPIQCDKLTSTKERLSYARVLVEVDLLADLRSSINVVLPNGSPLVQRVIYETLPKFCKHCRVLGHSIGACSKGKVDARSVEKAGSANVATMNNIKGSVFTRLSPPVDASLVDASPADAPPANAPPVDAPKVDAPIVPTTPNVVQDEKQCNKATSAGSEGWETIRKRKNNNGNKLHSLKTLLVESSLPPHQLVSAKGKASAIIVDINGSKALQRPVSGMLTRSSVQRSSNRFSGSGGVSPTLPPQ